MPTFEIKNTATNQVTTLDAPVLRPAGVLPVPYVSQLGPGADKYSGDCGAACGSMLLRGYNLAPTIDPDHFFSETGKDGGFLGISDIQNVLARHGLQNEYRTNMQASDLLSSLVQQKPVIMLINYGVLVKAGVTERKDFSGPHFFLAVGMDNKYVYIHDPYCQGNGGEARPYPYQVVFEAWSRAGEQFNNPVGAGVMPRVGLDQAGSLTTSTTTTTTTTTKPASGGTVSTPATPFTSYKVRIVMNGLNIRSSPQIVSGNEVLKAVAGQVYDVFEERRDNNTNIWGRVSATEQKWVMVRNDTAVKI